MVVIYVRAARKDNALNAFLSKTYPTRESEDKEVEVTFGYGAGTQFEETWDDLRSFEMQGYQVLFLLCAFFGV